MNEVQAVSSQVAKLDKAPEILNSGFTNWEAVKRVDTELDHVPTINARGAELSIDKQMNIDVLRKGTKMTVKGNEANPTNLVDHLTDKVQLTRMLQEGLRLNVITEADLKARGLDPDILHIGKVEQTLVEIPELSHLQKAEAMSLILQKLGERYATTTTLFIDELTSKLLDAKAITHVDESGKKMSPFDNQDILNVLSAAGREELSKYVLEQGYNPHTFPADAKDDTRRVMAKLVKKAYEGSVERTLHGETPYFVEGKPEYSAVVDMRVGQATLNALLPAKEQAIIEYDTLMAAKEKDPTKREELRHAAVKRRQIAYAAVLNAFGVEGYEKDGQVFSRMTNAEQNAILKLADQVRENKTNEEMMNRTVFEANRDSLGNFTAYYLNGSETAARATTAAFPLNRATLETYKEAFRAQGYSESIINDLAMDQYADDFVAHMQDRLDRTEDLIPEKRELLKTFFKERYATEQSLIRTEARRLKSADSPALMKISEAIDQGLKGVDLLYRRTITPEPQYKNYEEYVDQVKGAVENQVTQAASLNQGLEEERNQRLQLEQAAEAQKLADWDEAIAENNARDAEAQRLANEALQQEQQVAQQLEAERQAKVDYQNRTVGERETAELRSAIIDGLHNADEVQAEIDRLLGIGPKTPLKTALRAFNERSIKDPAEKKKLDDLKAALVLAHDVSTFPKNVKEANANLEARTTRTI